MLKWLQDWYSSQCDGDWEHDYGITIETLDNPGWQLTIDMEGTSITLVDKAYERIDMADGAWFGYEIENNQFNSGGDPQRLDYMISIFKELVDSHDK